MIRQAYSYLAGAVSGAALIAAAVVVFILLLASTQGFRDLPVVDIGGDESAAVAPARPASATTTAAGGARGAASRDGSATVESGGAEPVASGPQGVATSPSSGNPGGGNSPASSGGPASPTQTGGGSGSNSPGGGSGGAARSGDSVSGAVTGAVNDTVDEVDGALDRTGVTGVTEGPLDRFAGPNSVVGQTVDEAPGAVSGLPDGDR